MREEEQLEGFNYLIERIENGFIVVFLRKVGTPQGLAVKRVKEFTADIQSAVDIVIDEEKRLNPPQIVAPTEH